MLLSELNNLAKEYEYLIKAVVPLFIAIFMAYIAYQQWQTNERKRQQDLFDKRWDFYLRIKKNYDLKVLGLENPTDDTEFFIFNDMSDEANFLFGMDIADHINSINDNITLNHFNYTWLIEPFEKYLKIEKHEQITIWGISFSVVKFLYYFLFPTCVQKKIVYLKNRLQKKVYSGGLYVKIPREVI